MMLTHSRRERMRTVGPKPLSALAPCNWRLGPKWSLTNSRRVATQAAP
jgi:hypothetical protein